MLYKVGKRGLYEGEFKPGSALLLREDFAAGPADLALPGLGRKPGKVPDMKNELLYAARREFPQSPAPVLT